MYDNYFTNVVRTLTIATTRLSTGFASCPAYLGKGVGLLATAMLSVSCGAMAATLPQQQISSFSPLSGPVGTVITMNGSGFTGSSSVWIGNAHDASLQVVSDGQIKITVPADGNTGQIAVFNSQHAAFSPGSFTFIAATTPPATPQQSINGFSPTSGPVGTVITVSGSGFTGSNSARIRSLSAPLSVVSDTQVRVTVPANGQTGQVAIFNSLHAAFSPSSFTVTTASAVLPKPAISGISPSTGPVGTVIAVTGSGFTGASTAWVGTAHDAGLTVTSDTKASVTVPADGKTGQVTILNAQNSASAAATFTVTAPVTPPPSPPTSGLSIRVQGRNFIDKSGNVVQLRGVNYSGFEFVAVQGWSASDPSGGQAGQAGGPKWSAIQAWKANIVRIPLNEASWLGYSCTDTSGVVHNPDPGGNYKSAVKTQVDQATAAGLYVILDLHWTAPGTTCPMLQTQMADNDHSIAFWTSVAGLYKGYPNVMFELFNEPFLNFDFSGDSWAYMMNGTGGSFSGYAATSNTGNWQDVKKPWAIASYQAMINAVRATGATNVVLVGTMQYSQDLSAWLSHKPSDPKNQMAAVWHAYPTYGTTWGTAAYAQPNFSPQIFTDAKSILAAGIPVIATETGDRNTAGTVGAPLVSNVTQWADLNGVSVIGWAWDVWGDTDNVLIKDVDGTPSDGYGQVFYNWLLAH